MHDNDREHHTGQPDQKSKQAFINELGTGLMHNLHNFHFTDVGHK